MERGEPGLPYRIVRDCGQEHADVPQALLLRARCERPRGAGGETGDERAPRNSAHSRASRNPGATLCGSGSPLSRGRTDSLLAPPVHSITSSASNTNGSGTVIPEALAGLRINANSHF